MGSLHSENNLLFKIFLILFFFYNFEILFCVLDIIARVFSLKSHGWD